MIWNKTTDTLPELTNEACDYCGYEYKHSDIVLLVVDGATRVGVFNDDNTWGVHGADQYYTTDSVECWMPLPKPPKEGEAIESEAAESEKGRCPYCGATHHDPKDSALMYYADEVLNTLVELHANPESDEAARAYFNAWKRVNELPSELIPRAKADTLSAAEYINARRKMCHEYYGTCSEDCPKCPLYDNCEGLEMDAEDVAAIVQKWAAEQETDE